MCNLGSSNYQVAPDPLKAPMAGKGQKGFGAPAWSQNQQPRPHTQGPMQPPWQGQGFTAGGHSQQGGYRSQFAYMWVGLAYQSLGCKALPAMFFIFKHANLWAGKPCLQCFQSKCFYFCTSQEMECGEKACATCGRPASSLERHGRTGWLQ